MKPSFALTFSQDSVGLLHRTPSGWHSIGTVDLADPDLAGALDYLRRSALGLEPQGFATKLVIPNEMILYSTVNAPGPKAAQRRAQIAAALDGRTPYDLADLAFDWSGTGDTVQVAAVARETLAEAEAFAVEHGFNPVSFVAIPEPGGFAAEPWFGLTAAAPGFLAEGEKVVRDQDPIRIVQRKARTAPAPEEPATDVPVEAVAEADTPAPADQAAELAEPAPEPAPTPEIAPPSEPELVPQPEPSPTPEPLPDLPPADPEPEPEPLPVPSQPVPDPEPLPEIAPEPEPLPEPLPVPPQPEPMPTPEPVMVPPYADPAPADIPPELGADDGDQTQSWPGEADADPMAAAKAALAASLTPAAVPEAAPSPKAPRPMMAPVAADDDLPPAPASQMLRAVSAARAEAGAPKLTDKVQKALGKASRTTKGKSKTPVQRPVAAPPPPPLPPSASQPNVPQPKSEAEAMTVFGQRQQKIGGKPRFLGIALTGALLAILLVIAVWAAMFLDAPQDAAVTPETAAEAVATALPPAEPDAGAEATPDVTEPGTATTATAEPAPETLAATEEPEAVSAPDPAPAQAALPETAPDASSAAATAVRGPEGGRIDELTLPLPDQALGATPQARLAATPGSSNADLPPSAPVVLPAYGALYQFDAQGNILPTPEGVITPDGVRLVAGRPEIIPPRSPFATAPEPAAAALPAEAGTTAAPEQTAPAPAPGAIAIVPTAPEAVSAFQPDADLSGSRRPRSRPAGLAPAAPTTAPAAEEGALPAFDAVDTRLASRRPPVRPAAIAAAATAAAAAEQTRRLAEAAAAAVAAASTAAAQTEATASLAPTRRPPVRPASLTRSVETAVAAAVAQPRVAAPEPAVSRQSPSGRSRDGDIFDDGEPDTPQAAPSIPTRASVARQATVAGALNLGRTNLIGVFGTANNRYALVRESSGRLIKVKIGDRIDGGRVTAISASELSYQKGGNTVRLAMPRT